MTNSSSKIFFAELEYAMREHRFLKNNPVAEALENGKANADQIKFAIEQYSMLPAWIVRLLAASRGRLHGWSDVQTELSNNIGEEAGSKTGGLSHVEILIRGLAEELKLDVRGVEYSQATQTFLDEMLQAIKTQSPAFAVGIAYALEDSATPELLVLSRVLNGYASLTKQSLPISAITLAGQSQPAEVTTMEEAKKLSLDDFLSLHVQEFEPGHRNRLAQALTERLTDEVKQELKNGFDFTLDLMDAWWDAMVRDGKIDSHPVFDRAALGGVA